MAEEERSHSGGGGGGFSSDTDRSGSGNQRKVPQRGLGVAQLEKIRLEEERKRAAPCPSLSPPPSVPSSGNGGWCRLWNGDYNAAHRFFHFQQPASLPMVGVIVKRACPFSLETPPPRSFAGRFHQSPSCSRRCTARMESRNIYMSSSNPCKVLNGGDFLTLAPPSNSKHKFPVDISGRQGFEDNCRSQVYDSVQSRSREDLFSFFPVRSNINETCAPVRGVNGGKGETIDLNLKL